MLAVLALASAVGANMTVLPTVEALTCSLVSIDLHWFALRQGGGGGLLWSSRVSCRASGSADVLMIGGPARANALLHSVVGLNLKKGFLEAVVFFGCWDG